MSTPLLPEKLPASLSTSRSPLPKLVRKFALVTVPVLVEIVAGYMVPLQPFAVSTVPLKSPFNIPSSVSSGFMYKA